MDENILKELLIKKKNILEEIYEETLKGNKLLKQSETEMIIDILNTRQKLMDVANGIDKEIAAQFGGDFKRLIKYIDSKQCSKAADKVLAKTFEDTVICLKKIVNLDEENKRLITNLKSNLLKDIDKLNHAKSAMKGYGITGSHNLTGGAFIDMKK